MNNSYNKKEIKKECRDFKTIASRVLTSEYDTFDNNLKRFINYIDNTENIKKYITSCINEKDNFKIEDDVKQVSTGYGEYVFDSHIEENKEVSYTYQISLPSVARLTPCRNFLRASIRFYQVHFVIFQHEYIHNEEYI